MTHRGQGSSSTSLQIRGAQWLISAIASVCLILFSTNSAQAVVTPTSGPVSGGTSVTIEGIKFVKVSVGVRHALGLTSQGTVYSWGINGYGELGDGTTTNRSVPVQVKGIGGSGYLVGVTDISAGGWFSLALTNGRLVSWGVNSQGTLGVGNFTNSSVPVVVVGVGGTGELTGISSIAAGFSEAYASNGTNVYAWGNNTFGQLGNNQIGVNSSSPVIVLGTNGTSPLTNVTALAAGSSFGLAISNGSVVSWGANYSGNLGDGTTTNRPYPVNVLGAGGTGTLSGICMLAAGESFALASSGNATYAWGENSVGALGDGTNTNSYSPVQVAGVGGSGYLTGVTALGAGLYQSLAITSNGAVAWGSNVQGSLGNNSSSASNTPVRVVGLGGQGNLTTATSIDGGEYYSLAASPTGVMGWGQSYSILFGDGGAVSSSLVPVLAPNFQPDSITVDSMAPITPTVSGNAWSFTTPAHSAGVVTLTATANVFGGTTAANPSSVSWNAGSFTYEAALAKTGSTSLLSLGLASAAAVLLGVALLLALRRQQKK